MSFYTNRSRNFAGKISNKLEKNKDLCGYAIVFRSTEKDPVIYTFKEHFCQSSSLKNLQWSDPILINDVPWEDLIQIDYRLKFTSPQGLGKTIKLHQISPLMIAKTKFHRFVCQLN